MKPITAMRIIPRPVIFAIVVNSFASGLRETVSMRFVDAMKLVTISPIFILTPDICFCSKFKKIGKTNKQIGERGLPPKRQTSRIRAEIIRVLFGIFLIFLESIVD